MANEANSESHALRFRLLDFPPEIIARIGTFSPSHRFAFPTGALNRHLSFVFSDPRDIASRALIRYPSPEMALLAESGRAVDVSLISILCERGTDVNAQVEFRGEKCFPLQVAAAYGHLEAVQFLLDAGATIVISPFRNALLEASIHGYSDILKLLLDRGVDLARFNTGNICLRAAVSKGQKDTVRLLLDQEFDRLREFALAMHFAFKGGYLDIVDILLSYGAELNSGAPGRHGEECARYLVTAAHEGHLDAVKFLLNRGVKVNSLSGGPLIAAATGGRSDVVSFLLDCGAKIQEEALYKGACSGNKDVVQILLTRGAKTDHVVSRLIQDSKIDEDSRVGLALLTQCMETEGSTAR